MEEKLCSNKECTGCGACTKVCPKKAITMYEDERGFLRPKIDSKKCINCGRCKKFVQYLNTKNIITHKKYYGCKIVDNEKRMKSQSGGLYTALAETIIELGGIVYGCELDENLHVKHTRVDNIADLEKHKGSKYVQSDIVDCFDKIINDLKAEKKVLFSGTPCQVSAIYNFLEFKKVDKSRLYTCDIICHGVASPLIFKKYKEYIENKHNSKIRMFCFREKYSGWKNIKSHIEFENGDITNDYLYADLYYSNLALRGSCEKCKNIQNKFSDITIGDCWGFEEKYPNIWNDDLGISIAIINTKKGEFIFDSSKERMDIIELDSKDFQQHNLSKPSNVPNGKEKFWKDIKNKKFSSIMKKYTSEGKVIFKIRRKIMKKIGQW